MGNRSSSAPSSSSASVGEQDGGGGSGWYLSPELQAKINQDFDSHILQNEWDKYRASHLQRHHQRESSYSDREAEIRQRMESFRERARQVHGRLDDAIDASRAKLSDLEVQVGHEIDRLYDKFEGDKTTGLSSRGECLDVRAELSHCYNTLKDGGECQVFVQKLDRCVTEALRASS
ncbi:hypothetical protein ACHAW5_008921 [Stephanodiscus triporus]|uniref:Uncharacterized protein n=1 Tax=Stephanodiscus triporus TaxID=2934178 RepID=A0ABD3MN25_9STRA